MFGRSITALLFTVLAINICQVSTEVNEQHVVIHNNHNDPFHINNYYPNVLFNNVVVENNLMFHGNEIELSAPTVFKYSSINDFSISSLNKELFSIKYQRDNHHDQYCLHLNAYLQLHLKKMWFTMPSTLLSFGKTDRVHNNELQIKKMLPSMASLPILVLKNNKIFVSGSVTVSHGARTNHPFFLTTVNKTNGSITTRTTASAQTFRIPDVANVVHVKDISKNGTVQLPHTRHNGRKVVFIKGSQPMNLEWKNNSHKKISKYSRIASCTDGNLNGWICSEISKWGTLNLPPLSSFVLNSRTISHLEQNDRFSAITFHGNFSTESKTILKFKSLETYDGKRFAISTTTTIASTTTLPTAAPINTTTAAIAASIATNTTTTRVKTATPVIANTTTATPITAFTTGTTTTVAPATTTNATLTTTTVLATTTTSTNTTTVPLTTTTTTVSE